MRSSARRTRYPDPPAARESEAIGDTVIRCAVGGRRLLSSVAPGARPRVHALDGLRGAAALVVVAFHVVDYVALPQVLLSTWLMSPLGVLVNGPGAVHLFFVLSGFVLALTMAGDGGPAGVPRFYVRRLFRIQPPYAFAVLFAWVTSLGFPVVGGLARWMTAGNPCFHIPAHLLPRAMLLPSMAFGQLPVGWSLQVELVMSAAFPILWVLGRRIHAAVPLALGIAVFWLTDPRWRMIGFSFDFALGLALFLERERIARWISHLPRAAMGPWVLTGVMLLQLPYAITFNQKGAAVLEQSHSPAAIVLMSLGAGLLIVAAQHFPLFRGWLERPSARYFGRISYSLYLLHMPVLLFAVCRITGQRLHWATGLVLFGVVLVISIGLAELAWRWIEEPSIRAGRWLNGKLGAKRPDAAAT